MQQLPQTMPMSYIETNQAQVLEKLSAGPVLLLQQDEPAAVLVSTTEWNRLAKRLEALEQEKRDRLDADRVAKAYADGDPNKVLYIQTQVEEQIRKYRASLETHGALEERPLLSAQEFEQGLGDTSSFIRGSELRKVLLKNGMTDNAS